MFLARRASKGQRGIAKPRCPSLARRADLIQVGGDQSSCETTMLRRSAAVDFACHCFPKAVVLLPDTSIGVQAEATRSRRQ